MLAGARCLQCQGYVKVIGQRIVDDFDVWVLEELIVGAIGFRNSQIACKTFRSRLVARAHCDDGKLGASHETRYDPLASVSRSAQHSPADAIHSRVSTLLLWPGRKASRSGAAAGCSTELSFPYADAQRAPRRLPG